MSLLLANKTDSQQTQILKKACLYNASNLEHIQNANDEHVLIYCTNFLCIHKILGLEEWSGHMKVHINFHLMPEKERDHRK